MIDSFSSSSNCSMDEEKVKKACDDLAILTKTVIRIIYGGKKLWNTAV